MLRAHMRGYVRKGEGALGRAEKKYVSFPLIGRRFRKRVAGMRQEAEIVGVSWLSNEAGLPKCRGVTYQRTEGSLCALTIRRPPGKQLNSVQSP